MEAIDGFEVARNTPNAYLIMEGDWGGQIYLTAPVSLIRCSAESIEKLLHELDLHAWSCNQGEGCGAFFEKHQLGDGISGGMGGGVVTETVWLHPELVAAGLQERVHTVLVGGNRT